MMHHHHHVFSNARSGDFPDTHDCYDKDDPDGPIQNDFYPYRDYDPCVTKSKSVAKRIAHQTGVGRT